MKAPAPARPVVMDDAMIAALREVDEIAPAAPRVSPPTQHRSAALPSAEPPPAAPWYRAWDPRERQYILHDGTRVTDKWLSTLDADDLEIWKLLEADKARG